MVLRLSKEGAVTKQLKLTIILANITEERMNGLYSLQARTVKSIFP